MRKVFNIDLNLFLFSMYSPKEGDDRNCQISAMISGPAVQLGVILSE